MKSLWQNFPVALFVLQNFTKWNLDFLLEFLRISAILRVRFIVSLLQTLKRRSLILKYPTKTRSNSIQLLEFWTNLSLVKIPVGGANLILRAMVIASPNTKKPASW